MANDRSFRREPEKSLAVAAVVAGGLALVLALLLGLVYVATFIATRDTKTLFTTIP